MASGEKLVIAVPQDVLDDYIQFIKGNDPQTLVDFSEEGARRDVVEVVLIQQALRRGGISDNVEFLGSPSYLRILKHVEQGKAIMTGNSVWMCDLEQNQDKMFISISVVENGEFEAGLYTVPENTTALSAKTLEDIQQLTAVSSKHWEPDWKTLERLRLKKLHHVALWKLAVRMVDANRIDFLLAPFQPTEDFSFEPEGIRLVPIPNVKVSLHGSRHFAVSKTHPRGEEIFEAFNRGLKTLKDEGIVKQAYQQSGFFNIRVAEWNKLN
jgi:hypothetical protein